jgi:hypothetical protein
VSDGDDALDVVVFDGCVTLPATCIEHTAKKTNSTLLSTEPSFFVSSVMCLRHLSLSLSLSLSLNLT